MNERDDEARIAQRRRRLVVGSMWCAIVAVVLLTAWALAPHVLPVWKKHAIKQALHAKCGPSFWWPTTWREEYERRSRGVTIHPIGKFVGVDLDIAEFHAALSSPIVEDRTVSLLFPADAPDLAREGSRLAVIRSAPDFTLTDQAGESYQFSKLDGRVRLVSFIFTTCNGSCPATTSRMLQVWQELKSRGLLDGDRVRFVSITLDPERDTPEVLAPYRKLYDVELPGWRFLTGPPDDVRRVIDAWGMWARPAANGQLDHPSRIFLVDPASRIREIYNLSFLKPGWVAEDVKLLIDEATPSKVETR